MNPELLRNVWHELTMRRLIAMPLVLGIIFWGLSLVHGATPFAAFLFIVFTVLWGTFQAGDAVAREVADNTWDWQRLSTLTAWQLTWGKLLGATLFSWYAALICLGVRFFGLLPDHGIVPMVHVTAFLIGGALLGQGVAFLLGLQTIRLKGRRTWVGTLVCQIIGAIIGLAIITMGSFLPGGIAAGLNIVSLAPEIGWYGFTFSATTVATVSLALCLGWTLLGAHRVMLREMAHRTRPWAWPTFVLFACFYMAGFEPVGLDVSGAAMGARIAGRLVIATAVAAALTYVALFWDDKDPVVFRRLIRLAEARDWSGFAAYTPSFFVSAGITAALAVLLLIVGGSGEMAGVTIWAAVVAGILFMLRDIAINLYFWLAPNHNGANLTTLIALGLLYGLFPLVAGAMDLNITFLFLPFAPGPWVGVLCAAIFQVGVMAFVVARRWRKRFVLANA